MSRLLEVIIQTLKSYFIILRVIITPNVKLALVVVAHLFSFITLITLLVTVLSYYCIPFIFYPENLTKNTNYNFTAYEFRQTSISFSSDYFNVDLGDLVFFKNDYDDLDICNNAVKVVLDIQDLGHLKTSSIRSPTSSSSNYRSSDPIHNAIHDEVFIKIMESRRKTPEEIKAKRELISKLVGYDIDCGVRCEIIKKS